MDEQDRQDDHTGIRRYRSRSYEGEKRFNVGERGRNKNAGPPAVFSTAGGPALALFRYAPSLVKTGRTGAATELMRRSPESVNDINNPANR